LAPEPADFANCRVAGVWAGDQMASALVSSLNFRWSYWPPLCGDDILLAGNLREFFVEPKKALARHSRRLRSRTQLKSATQQIGLDSRSYSLLPTVGAALAANSPE